MPIGSPGVFIHCGTLGGMLSALPPAASASLPARPPAMTAPPANAPPLRRNRRREVRAGSSSTSVGSVIMPPPFECGAYRTTRQSPACRELLPLRRSCRFRAKLADLKPRYALLDRMERTVEPSCDGPAHLNGYTWDILENPTALQ